jgi:uncharacterized protein YraI
MKLRPCLLAAPLLGVLLSGVLLLAAPVSAQAAPGQVRTPVTLRAGPDIGFPAVDRIPRGAPVVVHGCLREGTWCDVSFGAERGWIAAVALDYFDGNRYVYLPDYVYETDVPVVTFALGTYWGSYYIGRPWFHRHAYWNRYWRTHPLAATQAPPRMQAPQGAVGGRMGPGMMPAQGAQGAAVAGMPQQAPAPRATTDVRPQGMMGAQPPVAVVPPGGTVGLAATPHMMQPNMGRVGGPPAAMHAQMGGMAHASVGAMSHAAPAGGRGSQSGGGHGGSDHRH